MGWYASTCRACGREIRFIKTKNDKQMPIEPGEFFILPDAHGRIYCTYNGSMVKGTEVSEDTPERVFVYKPHWAYCLYSDHNRARLAAHKALAKAAADAKAARRAENAAREVARAREQAQKEAEAAQYSLWTVREYE